MLMSVNYNSAVLKLVDRLTDVMLIRAGAHTIDKNNLQRDDLLAPTRGEAVSAYYDALKAWTDGGRTGVRPKKPKFLEEYETSVRVAQMEVASRQPGYKGPPYP